MGVSAATLSANRAFSFVARLRFAAAAAAVVSCAPAPSDKGAAPDGGPQIVFPYGASPTGTTPTGGTPSSDCTSSNGTTPAFYQCSGANDCAPGNICVDNAGDGAYYCKPLCTTTAGDCPVYAGGGSTSPGPGGGGACPVALCPDGTSSGVGMCDPTGSRLPPSYAGASCCNASATTLPGDDAGPSVSACSLVGSCAVQGGGLLSSGPDCSGSELVGTVSNRCGAEIYCKMCASDAIPVPLGQAVPPPNCVEGLVQDGATTALLRTCSGSSTTLKCVLATQSPTCLP